MRDRCCVLLFLLFNYGIFGGDGVYVEVKVVFEVLENKWVVEVWVGQILFVGVWIGWVRGTGLMVYNDDVVKVLLGIQIFSVEEMGGLLMEFLVDEDFVEL